MTLTVGSLFSGIGGLDLGLERAGMNVIWQSEIDPYASRVLAKHWPDVPNLGDITTIDWSDVEPPDLVAGGFSCQPVSSAGRQLVQDDARWIWPEFARCIRHLRPRLVLVENVRGLLERGMGDVVGDLASLGYDCEWDCLPAAAFGAPHRRDRVFLVAYPAGIRSEAGTAQGVFSGESVLAKEEADWGGDLVRGASGRVRRAPLALLQRMDDGLPSELDGHRLRALGNAVVPQVAEWVGQRLLAIDERRVS